MTTLLVADVLGNGERDLSVEAAILGPAVTLRRHAYRGDDAALIAAAEGAACILTDYVPFTAHVISELGDCRLISVAATGFGCVDISAAAAAGISVCAIDEYCTDEVADHTIMLLLALARKLLPYQRQVQSEHLWQYDSLSGLMRLNGKTLGIVGLGHIGQAVARRAAGFGLTVIACDPFVDAATAAAVNATLCDFDTLLANADIISLHCALTDTNRNLFNRDAFNAMKKSPLLINVARGGLINEPDLIDALDAGRVSAAGLDVLDSESPDLAASGLVGRDNVILTPHVAFYSATSILESRRLSAGNIRHHLDGKHALVRKYVHHANPV